MPAKKSFGAAALFWSFALGVTLALVVCAGVFKVINDAPVPFVTKVQTVQNEGDELRALKDPNQPLYKEGQGTEQKSADAVATITAAGTSDGPATAPADQAAADGNRHDALLGAGGRLQPERGRRKHAGPHRLHRS